MQFGKIFESAVAEFLRKYYGGSDYKKKKQSLKRKLREPEVVASIEKIKKSFGSMINRYVNYCIKYPLDIRASRKRWESLLTKKEQRAYADVRKKIDILRKEAGIEE